jgi:RHS repeat-associated protein
MQGSVQHCLFQSEHQLFAQHRLESGISESTLLSHDLSRSVLQAINSARNQNITYTAYGYAPKKCTASSLLGFNGEFPDEVTGHYLLGNGYRSFNPVLMRFNSPDNISPFGAGGLNSYAYCKGDPVNFTDSSGHIFDSLRRSLVSLFSSPLKKSQLSVSLDFTGGVKDGLSKYENIQRVMKGVYVADEPLIGGDKTLVINGHGSEGGHLISNRAIQDPSAFIRKMNKVGVFVEDYRDVHLMICHSAEGTANTSLARYLSSNFSVSVTAYNGKMFARYSPYQMVQREAKKIPWFYRSSFQVREINFVKSKQVDIRTSGPKTSSSGKPLEYNYAPVYL